MNILIDTREKERAIQKIVAYFDSAGITYASSKLYVGDYMSLDKGRLAVDRKQNLSEVYTNICHEGKSSKSSRFFDELRRAENMGIKLVFLIEHGYDPGAKRKIHCIGDVQYWENPQLKKSPYAWTGSKLMKEMLLLRNQHPIAWEFCEKKETGRAIERLLS